MSEAALLSAKNLACRRGGRPVFEGVSFEVTTGQAVLITGANGAGKSSLLRVLAGLVPLSGGELHRPAPDDTRYVGHLNALKAGFTVAENITTYAQLYEATPDLAGALSAFDLQNLEDLRARYLSAGQRRRVALARLIAAPAKLWLLDEPAAGLDSASTQLLEAAISQHLSAGGAAVIASHGGFDVPDASELRLGAA